MSKQIINNFPNPFPGNPNLINKISNIPNAGNNGILISFVLDESGSMSSCYNDTTIGFNEYIRKQKEVDTNTKVSLNKFNGSNIETVFNNININSVPLLDRTNYNPGGGTNLLDAIGTTLVNIDGVLSHIENVNQRPSILVIIMTDGYENSSRQFSQSQIKQMIKDREHADWTFMFLGANIDTFSVSDSYGISVGGAMSYNTSNMAATMNAVSSSTTRYRAARSKGFSSQEILRSGLFTDEEKYSAKGEK